jgi:cytochrome oxidase Cu insertion factor (SCO1/SenC/PrrC family)
MPSPWLTKRRKFLAAAAVAVASLGGGLFVAKKALHIQFRKPPMVGVQVPPMKLEFVSNATGSLELPPGKVMLLDFFESTCGPCQKALPKVQHRIQESDVSFVAVSIDEERDAAQKVAKDWGLVKPVAWDTSGEARKALQIVGIPNLVVLSPRGRVTGWFPYDPPDALLADAIEEAREDDPG